MKRTENANGAREKIRAIIELSIDDCFCPRGLHVFWVC